MKKKYIKPKCISIVLAEERALLQASNPSGGGDIDPENPNEGDAYSNRRTLIWDTSDDWLQ